MEFYKVKILLPLILIALPLVGDDQISIPTAFAGDTHTAQQETAHILYLMHKGQTASALEAYEKYCKSIGSHDFELVERLGLTLLDQGYRSSDSEIQLMSLFGAGVSANERSLYIIEEGMSSKDPQTQLIALNFLGRYNNDHADHSLHRAMSSNVLLIRLETVFLLCKKKDPKAVGLVEGLMSKLPEVLWPVFPQLFAACGTPQAKKTLRKLLAHSSEQVRVASIVSLAEYEHDDLLPTVRRLATQHGVIQQEASAYALGIFRDENSVITLQKMAQNSNIHVRLAALDALFRIGRKEVREEVERLAKLNDLYAIALLGKMPGSEDVLADLVKSNQLIVSINAAHALLELGDSRCLIPLIPVLIRDARDLAVLKVSSPAGTLNALKIVPSARQNFEEDPVSLELSLHLREEMIAKSVELPEQDFLNLAHTILELQQNDLIPGLIDVLENHPTPAVIELLKKHQQKAGAPLVRNYCNLALYRLKQQGSYGENLMEWVTQQRNVDLIRFRPMVPWDIRDKATGFELTPQESSRLLVDAFESFVAAQDDRGIDMLISVIKHGNPKNKYALIGLLMRAIQ